MNGSSLGETNHTESYGIVQIKLRVYVQTVQGHQLTVS